MCSKNKKAQTIWKQIAARLLSSSSDDYFGGHLAATETSCVLFCQVVAYLEQLLTVTDVNCALLFQRNKQTLNISPNLSTTMVLINPCESIVWALNALLLSAVANVACQLCGSCKDKMYDVATALLIMIKLAQQGIE